MLTKIEKVLFHDESAHWVSSFANSPEVLELVLHPANRPQAISKARFRNPHIVSVDDSYRDDVRELPWDVIGFDSDQLPDGLWRFCLHTDQIEYVFDSAWPDISRD
jgi:hypothetical protein